MANVSTEGMNAAAGSISGASASAKAAIENMKAEANKIIELCGRIEGFNGQYVSGHEPKTVIQYEDYTMENGEIGQKEIRFRSYQKWRVSSPSGISAAASSIISELESLEASLTDFGAAATEIEGRSDVIDSYMNTIMSQLGSNIDQSTLMGAFRAGGLLSALKLHIAYDAEQAANGQFISDDKILSEYWTDKPLSFERQENGTYAIYQEDDNGNQVLMGYTTGATALGYMTSLGKASGVVKTQSITPSNGKTGAQSKDDYLINKAKDEKGIGDNGKTGAQSKDDYLINKEKDEKGIGDNGKTGAQSKDDYLVNKATSESNKKTGNLLKDANVKIPEKKSILDDANIKTPEKKSIYEDMKNGKFSNSNTSTESKKTPLSPGGPGTSVKSSTSSQSTSTENSYKNPLSPGGPGNSVGTGTSEKTGNLLKDANVKIPEKKSILDDANIKTPEKKSILEDMKSGNISSSNTSKTSSSKTPLSPSGPGTSVKSSTSSQSTSTGNSFKSPLSPGGPGTSVKSSTSSQSSSLNSNVSTGNSKSSLMDFVETPSPKPSLQDVINKES